MRKDIWNYLTIRNSEFENERVISIQSISLASALLIGIGVPINIYLELNAMVIAVAILFVLFLSSWIFSRFLNRPVLAIVCFSVGAFFGLGITWTANGGTFGPSMLFFLLSMAAFIAITPRNWHMPIFWGHLLLVSVLIGLEYVFPHWITDPYKGVRQFRYFDIFASTGICLFGALLVYRHITNRYMRTAKRLKEKNQQLTDLRLTLQKINDEKDRLFSVLAHDLRSPLASLDGVLELIKSNMLNEEEKAEVIGELQALTHSSMFLVENMLYWSKYEAGTSDPLPKDFPLCDVLTQIEAILGPMARSKGVHLEMECDKSIVVRGHRNGIEVLLRNLVHNGVKFTPENGTVALKASLKDDRAWVEITDTGVGLEPERYYQEVNRVTDHTSGTSGEQGTGLGLALVKLLSERMRLQTEISRTESGGTRFTILFPF